MTENQSTTDSAISVDYYYIKSNQYRVIHADGAYGSVAARGYIHFSLYSERRAIPQQTTATVDASTNAVKETITAGKSGVVRELEVGVMMDETAALELAKWLQDRAADLRQFKTRMKEAEHSP